MRKILSLFSLLLLFGIGTAMAETIVAYNQVTSASDIMDGGQYVIRVNGGSYITESGTQYVAPSTQNTVTDNAIFTFHANGGVWRMKPQATIGAH